jgi:hypothetical protein
MTAPTVEEVRAIIARAWDPRRRQSPVARPHHPYQRHRYPPAVGSKRCSRCGAWKPRGDFHHNHERLDGFMDWCRRCWRAGPLREPVRRARRIIAQRSHEPPTIPHDPGSCTFCARLVSPAPDPEH